MERSERDPIYQVWEAINPNWERQITSETVQSNWDNLPETLRYGHADASSFWNLIDIDRNGQCTEEEICMAITGKRYACVDHGKMWEYDWKMDFDNDGIVSYEEFNRAFGEHEPQSIQEAYWSTWLTKGLSEGGLVSWGHIKELNDSLNEVMDTWNSTLAEHSYGESTDKISSSDAATIFDITDADEDQDVHFTYAEYCMHRLDVRVVCFDQLTLEIEAYDINSDGGVDWDEFNQIISVQEEMFHEAEKELTFDFYDVNNDGAIQIEEVRETEEDHTVVENFNYKNWLDASWDLMDKNHNDMVDSGEFNDSFNFLLRMVDLEKNGNLDDLFIDTIYNNVFTEGESQSDRLQLLLFIKEIVKRGIESYVEDNPI